MGRLLLLTYWFNRYHINLRIYVDNGERAGFFIPGDINNRIFFWRLLVITIIKCFILPIPINHPDSIFNCFQQILLLI